jgi:hypothetical protein
MTTDDKKRTRPTRAQRLVAAGFLGAFGLTILTVLLTGLWVRSPHARRDEPPVMPSGIERVDAPDQTAVQPRSDPLVGPKPTPVESRSQGQDEPDAAPNASEDPEKHEEDSTSDRDAGAPSR